LVAWAEKFTAREKGPSDLVTEADLASQEVVRRVVLGAFPEHEFLGEEGPRPTPGKAEYRWIVDPLDGTTNYAHRVPHYAVSVALEHRGKVVAGVVYDPTAEECFAAAAGQGATLNGRPIRASRVTEMSQALVAASFSSRVDASSPEISQFVAALLSFQGVRRTGSAALNMCYVACGRFDAFWALTTNAWDVAAGWLIVAEAGGAVTHADGQPLTLARPHPAASATPELHEQFLELLRLSSK
jgi:myo-inositol-1(or 4)-monophosphatase